MVRPTPAPPPQTASPPAPTHLPDRTPLAPAGTPRLAHTAPAGRVRHPEPQAPVVVQKYGGHESDENTDYPAPPRKKKYFFGLFGGGTDYRFLTPSVLDAIDRAHVRAGRWKYIVVHNSEHAAGQRRRSSTTTTAHVRHMPNGLAYHFVIGNGTSTGDGQIEIGDRWKRQINGGHVHSDYLNNIALGICLVGDFNRDIPTRSAVRRARRTDHLPAQARRPGGPPSVHRQGAQGDQPRADGLPGQPVLVHLAAPEVRPGARVRGVTGQPYSRRRSTA